MSTFTDFLATKYKQIQIDKMSFRRTVSCGIRKIPESANTELGNTITIEELFEAVKMGKNTNHPAKTGYVLNSSNECRMPSSKTC